MNIVVMDDRIKTVMANKELANTTMSFRSCVGPVLIVWS
jgi:hypothetical protein